MMRTFSTKCLVGLAVCGLFAVTMLSGCYVTHEELKARLEKFKAEDIAETVSQARANTGKVATIEKSVTAMGKKVEALNELKTKLEDLGKNVTAITEKLKALKDIPESVAANKKSLAALRTDTNDAKLARAQLTTELAKKALKSKLDDLSKSTDTNVARLDKTDKDLTGKDTELAASLSKLEKIAEALVTDVKTIKVFAARLDTEMKDLTKDTKASMSAQDKKIASIGGGMSTALTKEIDLLEKRIATLKEVLKGFGGNGGNGEPVPPPTTP